jgi:hypothetical protein
VVNGGKFKSGKLADGTPHKDRAIQYISEHVKSDPASLRLWGQIVNAYINIMSWSATSYTVMVNDYYANGSIPGEKTGRNGKNGHSTESGLTAIAGSGPRPNAPTPEQRADFQRRKIEWAKTHPGFDPNQ